MMPTDFSATEALDPAIGDEACNEFVHYPLTRRRTVGAFDSLDVWSGEMNPDR